jgi:hypothetical protein
MKELYKALLVMVLLFSQTSVSWTKEVIRPPEFETLVRAGYAKLETGQYEEAARDFQNAIATVPDKYDLPPALLYNMALALDKAPGHLLSAALWYKAYLELAPNDPRAPEIRHIVETLLDKFDRYVLGAATVLENSYEEIEKEIQARERYAAAPGAESVKNGYGQTAKESVEADRKMLPTLIAGVECARIGVGDVDTALKKLRQYGFVNRSDDNLTYQLIMAGRPSEARKYAKRNSDSGVLVEMGLLAGNEASEYDGSNKDLVQIMLDRKTLTESEASKFPRGKENLRQQVLVLAALDSGKTVTGVEESLQNLPSEERNRFDELGYGFAEVVAHVKGTRLYGLQRCRTEGRLPVYVQYAAATANRSYESHIYANRTPIDDPAMFKALKPNGWILPGEFSQYATQLRLLAFWRQSFMQLEKDCRSVGEN